MATSTPVHLYRYDLTNGMARSMSPMLVGRQVEGIWHTSIVVFGSEFFFDGGVGIARDARPGATRFGPPYRTELLGHTGKTESEFLAWVRQRQRDGFGPDDYSLLRNNCNHFSQAAARFLLDRDIPSDVRDMIPTLLDTPFGRLLRPTLEQMAGGGGGGSSAAAGMGPMQPQSSATTAPSSLSSPEGVGAGLLSPAAGLTDDQLDDLTLAGTMLESNELLDDGRSTSGVQATLTAVATLRGALHNILTSPQELKYRYLSMSSRTYAEKLKPFEDFGVSEVLACAGFKRVMVGSPPEAKWVLADRDGSAGVLRALVDALDDIAVNIETSAALAQSLIENAGVGAPKQGEHEGPCQGKAERAASSDAARSNDTPQTHDTDLAAGTHPSLATPTTATAHKEDSEILRFCSPPFPEGFTPLCVGTEGGSPLYSLYIPASESASSGVTGALSNYIRRSLGGAGAGEEGCFGKCRLSPDFAHVEAYYCSRDGRERHIDRGYAVLCLRRVAGQAKGAENGGAAATDEDALLWVPATLLGDPALAGHDVGAFVFHPSPGSRFGVVRAPVGSGVHPGVREPAGRCVVPYGGRAEVVTDVAEVLCLRHRAPPALVERVDGLAAGEELLAAMDAADGVPLGSFDALLEWDGARARAGVAVRRAAGPAPLRGRRCCGGGVSASTPTLQNSASTLSGDGGGGGGGASSQPRLLVCHDMGGGYAASERGCTFIDLSYPPSPGRGGEARVGQQTRTRRRQTVLDKAYTISYWRYVDVFCYFLHQRVAVPPRSWIDAAHRHGVPALGTIITEGAAGAADLDRVLTDAPRMARVISRLAEMCEVFGFDGYLLNIENRVDTRLAKRLVWFTDMLRKRIKEVCPHGLVIWYDAVTIDGALVYQNALTSRNKPFFDVSDAIFTNYFWNPMHLAATRAAAMNRPTDVFVGVDVYGRRMFGGGRYNTHAATREVLRHGLSIALFAPAWTLGEESGGTRDNFLRAECRLWSRLQTDLPHRPLTFSLRPPSGSPAPDTAEARRGVCAVWTSFATGAATHTFVNGQEVVADAAGGGYCQLDAAHLLPPFHFEEQATIPASSVGDGQRSSPVLPSLEKGWTLRLPLVAHGGRVHGGDVQGRWRTDRAWYGDQSLSVVIPPSGAVSVLDACVTVEEGAVCEEVVVDLALFAESAAGAAGAVTVAVPALALRAAATLRTAATAADGDERLSVRPLLCTSEDARVVHQTCVGNGCWQVVRFNLSAAAALATASVTFSSTGEGLPRHGGVAELTGLSLLNTSGSNALACTLGGIAIHVAPRADGGRRGSGAGVACGLMSDSPLVARGPYTWPSFALHPTRRASEQVLVLERAAEVVAQAAQESGAAAPAGALRGQEQSIAVLATVHRHTFSTDTAVSRRVFLGVHRLASDAQAVHVRLHAHCDTPDSRVAVTDVQYYVIAAGY